MNIWLISLFDPTPIDDPISPRFIGIADAAIKRGHTVRHFSSTFRHTTKKQRFDNDKIIQINENYIMQFIWSIGYQQNMLPKRFIAHRDFANRLIKELDLLKKPDAIFISMPPISTVSQVTKWGKRNGVPVIIDIIDPWPDSFLKDIPAVFHKGAKLCLTSFYRELKVAFADCAALTAISKGYLDWASQYHDPQKKNRFFYLAVDHDLYHEFFSKFRNNGLKKNSRILQIIYAGSLASSYDIPTILKAAKIIEEKHPGKTNFVISGTGPQKNLVIEASNTLPNISYLGWVSREELFRQYYLADLGLIQHKNSKTQTITYKFFNYLCSGMPVLNSLQSEMADIISRENIGKNNKEGDAQALVENIEFFIKDRVQLKIFSDNAIRYTEREGHAQKVYRSLVCFIEEIAQQNRVSL